MEQTIINTIKEIKKLCDYQDNLEKVDMLEKINEMIDETILEIIKCSKEDDELVQVAAIEALRTIANYDIKTILRNKLSSNSWLVRSYAIEALGDIQDIQAKKLIFDRLENNPHEEEIPRIYYALVKMGSQDYLEKLINLLNHEYYRIRIAAANLLEQLMDEQNSNEIISYIRKRYNQENEHSVKMVLRDIINQSKGGR